MTHWTPEQLLALSDDDREQRLQEMLAEFEAVRDGFCDRAQKRNLSFNVEHFLNGTSVDWFANHFLILSSQRWLSELEATTVAEAARRYIIARDFDEFDPDRADMLWKLQNGADEV